MTTENGAVPQKTISQSTPITIGLACAVLGLAFSAGVLWQKVIAVEDRSVFTQEVLYEVKEISSDNKRRIDWMERRPSPP